MVPMAESRVAAGTGSPADVLALRALDQSAVLLARDHRLLGPERVFLNPDCGFGTFAERPVNSAAVAERKLATLVAGARLLRTR